jgi:prevent-host-death family protein
MVKTISISTARNRLPTVIEEVLGTREEVVVTRYGTPLVAIMPCRAMKSEDRYPLRGHPVTVTDDFDEPMPEVWNALAVAEERGTYLGGSRPSALGRRKPTSGRAIGGRPDRRKQEG